jgi:hypothetical protein
LSNYLLQLRKNYLAQERFPADWAVADMVKQYLRGQGKNKQRQAVLAGGVGTEDDGNDDEDEGLQVPRGARHIDNEEDDE